jgi:hypothetical protein
MPGEEEPRVITEENAFAGNEWYSLSLRWGPMAVERTAALHCQRASATCGARFFGLPRPGLQLESIGKRRLIASWLA